MASLMTEVFKEERLISPVEYYVDRYARPKSLIDRTTRKANENSYKKYLADYKTIYKKRRNGDATDKEIKDNFDKKIKLERERRRNESTEERKLQKTARSDERVFANTIKEDLKQKTYGRMGQVKDLAREMSLPPSSSNIKRYKRNKKEFDERKESSILSKVSDVPEETKTETKEGGKRKTKRRKRKKRRKTRRKRRKTKRRRKKKRRTRKRKAGNPPKQDDQPESRGLTEREIELRQKKKIRDKFRSPLTLKEKEFGEEMKQEMDRLSPPPADIAQLNFRISPITVKKTVKLSFK